MSTQRVVRLVLAILGSTAALGLSWPYWRDFNYWATSHSMWQFYLMLGFVLGIYVFYAFIDSIETLFEHAALEQEEAQAESSKKTPGDTP